MAKNKEFPAGFSLFPKAPSSRFISLHIVLWIFLLRIWHQAFVPHTTLMFNLLENAAAGVSFNCLFVIALSFLDVLGFESQTIFCMKRSLNRHLPD